MNRALRFAFVSSFGTVLSLTACSDTATSNQAWVIAPDGEGNYDLRRRTIPASNLSTLENDHFAFEARSVVYPFGSNPRTENPQPVRLSLVESDGAYAATDQDSLVALSAAHHLFVAREYFMGIGLAEVDPPLPRQKVVLFPKLEQTGYFTPVPLNDNAFHAPGIGGFAILREQFIDGLPLGANLGVLAHEFSHAVFWHLLGATEEGRAILGVTIGLNEGLADVHGFAVTHDALYVSRSALAFSGRDLSVPRAYDPAEAEKQYENPYWYGSIVASTFWRYRRALIESQGIEPMEATRLMSRTAFVGVANFDLVWPTATDEDRGAVIESGFWSAFADEAERTGHRAAFCEAVLAQLEARPALYAKACP